VFEKDLKERLQRIFDFQKTRFDDPGESMEQECLFINIEQAMCHIKEKKQIAQVSGQFFVFATFDKLPYGYFVKQIHKAYLDDTAKFFFHEIDTNLPVMNNIVRRSVRFVFFFEAEYDPRQGSLTSVEFQEGEG
jgi:hypothetical protein